MRTLLPSAEEPFPGTTIDANMVREPKMPSSQLKRAERTIEQLTEQSEVPPGVLDVLKEIVDVVRALESRLALLENNQAG